MEESDFAALKGVERDAHGHVRIAEIAFAEILKQEVQMRLREYGIKMTIVPKNIGYELRCADPIPYDMEYARDLGYCAARYLAEGGTGAVVAMHQGSFQAVPFDSIMDPTTGRMRVRMVDIANDRYMIARRYMLRLRKDDFDDSALLAGCARIMGISIDEFQAQFQYLVENEPVPRPFFTPPGDE
jgi:ATP-dependent phosphofructokinase / diphosphate-dependent phosphofructokinase